MEGNSDLDWVTREETAVHEAGHYVASYLLGQMPGEASIEQEETTAGRVKRLGSHELLAKAWVEMGDFDQAQAMADCAAFIAFAGGAAVDVWMGKDPLGCDGDYDSIIEVLECVSNGDVDKVAERFDYLEAITYRIFCDAKVGAAVRLVAESLLTRGVLPDGDDTGDEVLKLLGGKTYPHLSGLVELYCKPKRSRKGRK